MQLYNLYKQCLFEVIEIFKIDRTGETSCVQISI